MVEKGTRFSSSFNGRFEAGQFPLEILTTSEQMLTKGLDFLSYARRDRAVVSWLNQQAGKASKEDMEAWNNSQIIHKQASLFLIGSSKLREDRQLTQKPREDKARIDIISKVVSNGGTFEQGMELANYWIDLTKVYQRQIGVKDTSLVNMP